PQEDMPHAHLHELFVDELRDILGAEKQLLKGLKKLSAKATSSTLKSAFEEHYEQTEQHVERLKQALESIGMASRSKRCKAMEGLLEEADDVIESFEPGAVL